MSRGLDGRYRGPFVFTEHHESHAASAFFPSPFDSRGGGDLDGVGEWATSTVGAGRGTGLSSCRSSGSRIRSGCCTPAFTYYTGFREQRRVQTDGLAPTGNRDLPS